MYLECTSIHKYASCSNECFILALIYIDRLIQRNNFLLTELNVHRVVICAVLLAAKFFDDAYYNNAYYAKVGGVLVSEINGLEVDFLFRINFSLHVSPEEFEKYRAELLQQATAPTPEVPTMYPAPVQVSPEVSSAPATMEAEPMGIAPCAASAYQQMHITPSPSAAHAPMVVSDDHFHHQHHQYEPMMMAPTIASYPNHNNFTVVPHPDAATMQRANSMPPLIKPVSPPSFPPQSSGSSGLIQPRVAFHVHQSDSFQMMAEHQQYGVMPTVVHHHHGSTAANATACPASPNYNVVGRMAGVSGAGM